MFFHLTTFKNILKLHTFLLIKYTIYSTQLKLRPRSKSKNIFIVFFLIVNFDNFKTKNTVFYSFFLIPASKYRIFCIKDVDQLLKLMLHIKLLASIILMFLANLSVAYARPNMHTAPNLTKLFGGKFRVSHRFWRSFAKFGRETQKKRKDSKKMKNSTISEHFQEFHLRNLLVIKVV